MPDQLAHYLFARRVYRQLNPGLRARIEPDSQAFRAGTFGPDPLFNDLNARRRAEGFGMHHRAGALGMERMRGALRSHMPYAAEYAAGFFCHYALDRLCHPEILRRAARGDAPHLAIETAYDRELLRRSAPVDISRRMVLTDDMCRAAAHMYTCVSAKQYRDDVNAYWKIRRMLIASGGSGLGAITGRLNAGWEGIIPRDKPTPAVAEAISALDQLIDAGVAPVAEQLERYFAAVDAGRPLDDWLKLDYSGKMPAEEA